MRTIACFGDSLIQGFPFTEENSWIARSEFLNNINMLNYGRCGECCDDISDRLTRRPLPQEITHVLYEGGMNDIVQGSPLSFTLEHIQKAAIFCREQSRPLCLVLPWRCAAPELNPCIERLRNAMQNKFSKDCYLLDFSPVFKEPPPLHHYFIWDGVHPTAETYQKLGDFAAPRIENWIKDVK